MVIQGVKRNLYSCIMYNMSRSHTSEKSTTCYLTMYPFQPSSRHSRHYRTYRRWQCCRKGNGTGSSTSWGRNRSWRRSGGRGSRRSSGCTNCRRTERRDGATRYRWATMRDRWLTMRDWLWYTITFLSFQYREISITRLNSQLWAANIISKIHRIK